MKASLDAVKSASSAYCSNGRAVCRVATWAFSWKRRTTASLTDPRSICCVKASVISAWVYRCSGRTPWTLRTLMTVLPAEGVGGCRVTYPPARGLDRARAVG